MLLRRLLSRVGYLQSNLESLGLQGSWAAVGFAAVKYGTINQTAFSFNGNHVVFSWFLPSPSLVILYCRPEALVFTPSLVAFSFKNASPFPSLLWHLQHVWQPLFLVALAGISSSLPELELQSF